MPTSLRWPLLWAALACGAGFFVILGLAGQLPDWLSGDIVFNGLCIGAALFQELGTLGARAHLKSHGMSFGLQSLISFAASVCWIIVVLAGFLGVMAGSGGLPIAFFLLFPAALLGLALQVIAALLFMRTEAAIRT